MYARANRSLFLTTNHASNHENDQYNENHERYVDLTDFNSIYIFVVYMYINLQITQHSDAKRTLGTDPMPRDVR